MDKLIDEICYLMTCRYFMVTTHFNWNKPIDQGLDKLTAKINLLESILDWT